MNFNSIKKDFVVDNRVKEDASDKQKLFECDEATDLIDKKTLLLSNYTLVKAYLSVFGINPSYIDDAVQDTMIEALTCLDSLKDVSRMKYWLLVIAKRIGIRYVTAQNTEKEVSFEECMEKGMNIDLISDRELYGFISLVDDDELTEIISNTLTEKEKKVIILYYVYGHKLKEIASMLGETETNTRTLSARAKRKIKEKLEKGGIDER